MKQGKAYLRLSCLLRKPRRLLCSSRMACRLTADDQDLVACPNQGTDLHVAPSPCKEGVQDAKAVSG